LSRLLLFERDKELEAFAPLVYLNY
jgi:hypothetical protein